MTDGPRRLALLSLHTSPLAPLGGRETGGMNVYVGEIARALSAEGVAVDVFTRRDDVIAPEIEEIAPGARLVRVTAGPPERIEKEAMVPFSGTFADGVAAFAAREGLRYDLLHSHYWLSAVAGEELAARWSVPHVAMFHTLAEVKLRARASERESVERREAERRLVHAVDRVVAATDHERRLLERLYRVPQGRVSVIPLGVDLERFRPGDRAAARAALGVPADTHMLLSVGRIEPLKGLDILIAAVAEMTLREHVRLYVVGGDERAEPELQRLRELARYAGVEDRVAFVGAVPHEELPRYYAAADVVVMPSFYESFGLVAVEAMASGVPVVASRVGGLTSTVVDGRTGYLVPWRCPGPFAEKLDLLLENAALREALGGAAAEAMRAYEWPSVASRLLAVYRELLAADAVPVAAGG